MVEIPAVFPLATSQLAGNRGMSLHDWFAGQALVGLLSSGKWDNSGAGFEQYISAHASNIADAMLAARTTPIASPGNHASNRGSVEGDHNRREPGA